MTATGLFDRGLQPERTLLAWRRTCLALATAMAVLVKLLAFESDIVTIVVGVAALAVPTAAWLLVAHRYRRLHQRLTDPGSKPALAAGGPAIAVATLAAALFGMLALVLVLR